MKYIVYLGILFSFSRLAAQLPADSVPRAIIKPASAKRKLVILQKDTAAARHAFVIDSLKKSLASGSPGEDSFFTVARQHHSYRDVLERQPYYRFFAMPENIFSEERPVTGKDALFYILAGLLLFFALIRLLFNRYVSNLLGLVFRGSLRQKQIREQLLQTPLPSLFLNIFFVLVAGVYVFFLMQYYHVATNTPFWLLIVYCVLAVSLVYLVKFVILKLTGWIFNMSEAADTYIFIVFLVNKLLAIFLLPLLIVMAFSLASWSAVLLTLSYIMVIMFFAYRYVVSFAPVRREVKVSQFHFFMYLCAFEIIPLLLIYKVLVHFF